MMWVLEAACRGTDIDVFFPDGRSTAAATKIAKQICASCPVRMECLSYAIEAESGTYQGHRHGIYGGLTPQERASMDGRPRRARRIPGG